MAVCRGFLLFLILLGSMLLITLLHYDMSQKNEAERILQTLEQRKQLLRETCDSDEEVFPEGKRSFKDLTSNDLDQFLVDDYHGIIYCFIPKAGSTNLKRVMTILKQNQNEPYGDPMAISHGGAHQLRPLLSSFPRPEIEARLKHYTKFMFVREPFVRLISNYRDKFLHKEENVYKLFAHVILNRFGNVPNPPQRSNERNPSFYNFIQYLLDPRTEREGFNEHWKQMHRLCHPCIIPYDLVGHQETFSQDAEQLLKLLMLQDAIKMPPSYENMTSLDSLMNWFKTVPLEDRRKLYKLYEKDYKLFGYRRPDEVLDG